MSSIFCIKRITKDADFEPITFDASIKVDRETYNIKSNPSRQDKTISLVWFWKDDDIGGTFDCFPSIDKHDEESDFSICPQLLNSIPMLFKDFGDILDIGMGYDGCVDDWEYKTDILNINEMDGSLFKYNCWYRIRIQ